MKKRGTAPSKDSRMPRKKRSVRLPFKTEWLLLRLPTVHIERTNDPMVLNLDQAIAWIRREKPVIWLGSMFSVPEPSGFPSGYAMTKSLLDLVLTDQQVPNVRQELINQLLPRWPLEALLDEFEFLGFDLSESLLSFFKRVNKAARPNLLHKAVVSYYKNGMAGTPLCVSTNWDTLQEKAFRDSGYTVVIGGPGKLPNGEFGKEGADPNKIFVYHPHGSFETRDVVCSLKREQRQLQLSFEMMSHPTLFLGYSGYEPSLYRRLEFTAGQLWCVRHRSDFEIPAKRRLLSRPNAFVFVGDMQELLRALGFLEEDLDLTSKFLSLENKIPPKLIEVLRLGLLGSIDVNLCVDTFANTLVSFHQEPEATIRYVTLLKAIINHTRNRRYHPGLLLSLVAGARFHNTEQTWISLLAYLLRIGQIDNNTIYQLIKLADGAAEEVGEIGSFEDQAVYMPGVLLNRTMLYKSYLRLTNKINDEKLYIVPTTYGSDTAAEGENMELLAFEYLRDGKNAMAQDCFDYAATSFYLCGLWRAGQLNEWASRNTDSLVDIAKKNTLFIPGAGT